MSLGRASRAVLGLAAVALAVTACSSSSSSKTTASASGTASATAAPPASSIIKGGTATYAFDAGAGANYIFPVVSGSFFSVSNSQQFQWLMFRPLYWFGQGATPQINDSLSLANEPTYSADGKTATIVLKPYKWSDGTPVTSRDIQFWENIVAANADNYGGSVPGAYPSNIVKTTVVNPTTISFTTDKAYNTQWFLYNELSNITPMPQHVWDKTSDAGPVGDSDMTPAGAKAVYKYLDGQSKKLSTYATNPLWQTVDGPWKLTAFDTNGNLTMVPNPTYSGPVKPTLASFKEQSFTDTAAEFNSLSSGSGPDVGFISNVELASQPRLNHLGYTQAKQYFFQVAYTAINFNNPVSGPILKQVYVRQALEMLVDQAGLDKAYFNNIGYVACGPVPIEPPSAFADATSKSCPFAYNPAKAISTLTAHGWKVVPGGTTTCATPGTGANQCGAGIAAGAKLEFPFIYDTGGISYPKSIAQEKSDAAAAGVTYDLKPLPFSEAESQSQACKSTDASCTWAFADTAWVYSPDYYPSGEDLFQTGAGSNYGSYSDPQADKLIAATTLKTSQAPQAALNAYQDYLVNQIPVLWQGSTPTLTEYKTKLHGVVPFNTFGALNPENWYFTK